jgi:hypothetical protein
MSNPKICPTQDTHTKQCQDVIMHLLFSCDCNLLNSLIIQSINSIYSENPTDGVKKALTPFIPNEDMSPALLRVIFFVLLNQDNNMRNGLCKTKVMPYLPIVCPFKACRLYDHLRVVMVEWVKNEHINILEMVDNLKEAYLVS